MTMASNCETGERLETQSHEGARPASSVVDEGSQRVTASNNPTGDRLEMLVIWIFVVLSFAALIFAGYLIRIKI